jgi:hypothetical protein
MRQGQQNQHKRMRNRNHRKGPNPLTRSFESNGGDVKIRGTALHIAEKYVQLARDAQSSGDRVAGENYLQHAEHYYRLVAAAQAQMPQPQPVFRSDGDDDFDEDRIDRGNAFGGGNQPFQGGGDDQQAFGQSDQQPYMNGANGQQQPGEDMPRQGNGPHEQQHRFDNDRGGQNFNDNRGDNRGRDRGDFRGRRRRPFRDRYPDQGGGNRNEPQDGGPPPLDSPLGDD